MRNSDMNWGINDQKKYDKRLLRISQIKRLTD